MLYTGDYSREEDDRHLMQAELPPGRPDVLISVRPAHCTLLSSILFLF